MSSMILTMAVLGVVGLLAIALTVKKLLYICQPNEVLIFSGGSRRVADGRRVRYKAIKGGRKIKIPLFEVVDRMDLTNMAISVAVHGAFSKGGIPLNVDGVANVKIAGTEPALGNAVERLLGKGRAEIIAIAKETLEGNLRGVLATLTPEEVNADKLAFAQRLMDEADHDLTRLGIELDTLKIQNVSDGVGYLDSIGRISGAEVRKKARIVEAEAKADAVVRDAENRQRTELVRIEAAIRTMTAEAQKKVTDAETQKDALIAEANGQIGAQVVQARAELDMQSARVEQVKRQLEADVIASARAKMQAAISTARGDAAQIIEQGRATVAVLRQLTAAYLQAGSDAREVFLLQKLDGLVDTLSRTVESVAIDKVTVLGLQNGGSSMAPQLISANEQLKAALGVDVLGALQRRVDNNADGSVPPVPRS
ncbi:MAG: flotillin family protein [Deltaproteobacteria bacterium]|nr:flotillin family protein [Deltaproteobacteria bacterium]